MAETNYRTDEDAELQQARKLLEEQATELRENAVFPEMNPGPVCRLDLTATVLRANRAALSVFGEDFVGHCWKDILPGLTSDVWERIVHERERIWIEAQVGETYLGFTMARAPESRYVFAYGSDITELKNAQRELADLARFPEKNPGPVLRLKEDGSILLANPSARRLFHGGEIIGRKWTELCPGMTPQMWSTVLKTDSTCDHEIKIADRHMLFTHAPDRQSGQVFVYGTDLTELKTAETALHQSERMATLGTLAAGVAHELNNPAAAAQRAAEHLQKIFGLLQEAQLQLNKITPDPELLDRLIAFDKSARDRASAPPDFDTITRSDRESDVEMWLEDHEIQDGWDIAPSLVGMSLGPSELDALADDIDESYLVPVIFWLARTYPVYAVLEEIRHGTGRISEIVTALKAYSFVGQAPVQAVDVNVGIRNTLIILQAKLKRGITVQLELDEALPTIQAFGGELNQVWTNLIDNAADALQDDGCLTLRSSSDDNCVRVEVEDDGPGIPESIQGRIFDPFFTTKEPGHGTGLGLNTTYNIVKKHGGSIELRSVPGRTCFTIRLPLHLDRDARAKASDDGAQGLQQE